MVTADEMEAVFARHHALRDALVAANNRAQPKMSVWPSVLQFALKAVPPKAVGDLITNLGKAAIARRQEAQADKPVVPVQPKPPAPHGRPKEADSRSSVSFVGTLLDDDKAVETAKPQE